MQKKVLVIIVTYNAMRWIDRCLKSLSGSNYPVDAFIADNGSTDGTIAYIQATYPKFYLVCNINNLGFGKANNLGLRHALEHNYHYVYLLNQDAWILPDTIEKLLDVHSRHREFGILSPFQMEANMKRIDEGFLKGVCSWSANKNLFNDYYTGAKSEIYAVPGVMAAHWLISRECLKKVGLFSPSFPHYGEDVNYAERVKFFKYMIGIVPESQAVHDRENRKDTREKLIYIEYIRNIRVMSSFSSISYRIKKVLSETIKTLLKYRSYKTIKYTLMLLLDTRKILRNREVTMHEGAFIG